MNRSYQQSTMILVRLQPSAAMTVSRSWGKLSILQNSSYNFGFACQPLLISTTTRSMMVDSITLNVRPSVQRGVGLSASERAALREARKHSLNDTVVKEAITDGSTSTSTTASTTKKSSPIIAYVGVAAAIGLSVVATTGKIQLFL
jgi:hypothetical protein